MYVRVHQREVDAYPAYGLNRGIIRLPCLQHGVEALFTAGRVTDVVLKRNGADAVIAYERNIVQIHLVELKELYSRSESETFYLR